MIDKAMFMGLLEVVYHSFTKFDLIQKGNMATSTNVTIVNI